MTLYMARLIQSCGYSVVVISRGYKGRAEVEGGVVSDGKKMLMAASACGDEAYMMAGALENIPVMVGRDRYAMGRTAVEKFSPQVILLDDAFQHIRLERDIDLVLLDADKPFGNGKLFPRGVLREGKDALQRAGAVVLTRATGETAAACKVVERHAPGKPIFQCGHRPYIVDWVPANSANGGDTPDAGRASGWDALKGRRGYVFSGIAGNDRFQETMERAGVRVRGTSFFDDHHWYSERELEDIMQSAARSGADLIITTQKDAARIPQAFAWLLELVVVGVEIQFPDDRFDQYILRALAQASD
jgi:tetraacyldisaccharide 4'-kinase